jgi:DNA-binding response OmpR family regulator
MSTAAREPSHRGETLPGLGANDPAPDYTDGRLSVRPRDFIALADGEVLRLTPLELGLLAALIRSRDAVRTRAQVIEATWGPGARVGARNVDTRIKRLRDKLREATPEVDYIHTHPGIGYRFGPERVNCDG